MCVAFYLYDCLEKYIFVLAFNRDEIFQRDTLAAHWWTDKQGIIGGRDCLGKGTWLCAGVNGRVAFLTNVRNRRSLSLNGSGPTRGELPVQFVSEVAPSPEAFLQGIDVEAYSPFNLIVADLSARPEGKSQVWYLTNSPGDGPSQANEAFNLEEGVSNAAPQQVNPGTHGVSNASLDTPWPKVTLGRRRFDELAGRGAFDGDEFPFEEVFGVMLDSKVLETDPDKLPNTGYPPALEAAASAIFVDPVQYGPCVFGTRSTTVLAVGRDGMAELRERYLTEDSSWAEERHVFKMAVAPSSLAHARHPDCVA